MTTISGVGNTPIDNFGSQNDPGREDVSNEGAWHAAQGGGRDRGGWDHSGGRGHGMRGGGGEVPTGGTVGDDATTSAYNKLMGDVAASGTSAATLTNDVSAFDAAAAAQGPNFDANTVAAANGIADRISTGSYTKQSAELTLETAAGEDGMGGVASPPNNLGVPLVGDEGGVSPLEADAATLNAEMQSGQPSSTIENDAEALNAEATSVGDGAVANAEHRHQREQWHLQRDRQRECIDGGLAANGYRQPHDK
jgi:hypothetical protein